MTSSLLAKTSYWNRAEGEKIAKCMQDKILHAENPSVTKLQIGKVWSCKRIIYLWNAEKDLDIVIDHNEHNATYFQFQETPYTKHDGIVANVSTDPNLQTFGFFANNYLAGFSSHEANGLPPHPKHFVTFDSEGLLLWETVVRDADYHYQTWPKLNEHPLSVYDNYPFNPPEISYRAVQYGICSTENIDEMPCFDR